MLTFVSISKNELMKKSSSDRTGQSPDLIRKIKTESQAEHKNSINYFYNIT